MGKQLGANTILAMQRCSGLFKQGHDTLDSGGMCTEGMTGLKICRRPLSPAEPYASLPLTQSTSPLIPEL